MLCSSHTFNVQNMLGVRPWTVCVLVPLVSHFTVSLESSSLLSFNIPLCIILLAKFINYTYYKGAQPQTSDMPIAEAMIANSYVRHSNLCWGYTIQQLARLMNWPPLFLAWYPPHSCLKWLFLASESLFFIFPFFSTHTPHHIIRHTLKHNQHHIHLHYQH